MYQRLFATGTRLREGLAAAARKHGLPAQVSGEPPVFDIFFTDREVVDYRATFTADRDRIKRFNQELVRRRVVKAVNKIYVSLAHTDEDVDGNTRHLRSGARGDRRRRPESRGTSMNLSRSDLLKLGGATLAGAPVRSLRPAARRRPSAAAPSASAAYDPPHFDPLLTASYTTISL